MQRDWWDNGQIQIFAAQWLMGHFFVRICQSLRLILKRKMPTGQPIVEETLTSGKYIWLFLILILYIYIKLKKLLDAPRIFWRNTQKLAIRENCASEENKCTLFVGIHQVKTLIAIVYIPQEKNMSIILNAFWIFIIIHHFCMATLSFLTYGTDGRLDEYLSLRCIY